MDIFRVAQGLADTMKTNCVINSGQFKLTTYPYTPDAVAAPCAFVAEYSAEFDASMRRSKDILTVTIRVLVGRTDDISAHRIVASLFSGSGAASLKTALELGRGTPGQAVFYGTSYAGACDDFHVVNMQGNRWYQHGTDTFIGGELTVRVIGIGG